MIFLVLVGIVGGVMRFAVTWNVDAVDLHRAGAAMMIGSAIGIILLLVRTILNHADHDASPVRTPRIVAGERRSRQGNRQQTSRSMTPSERELRARQSAAQKPGAFDRNNLADPKNPWGWTHPQSFNNLLNRASDRRRREQ